MGLKILIADDHAVIRKGLKQILLEAFPDALISEAVDAEEVTAKTIADTWDIVITDLSMPGRSGLDVAQDIKQNFPKLPVLILSIHPEEQYAIRALKSGASGYISKDAATEELVAAVKRLLAGKKYISSEIADKLANGVGIDQHITPHELLSNREYEIFILLAQGKQVSEIAEQLHLGVTTISTYRNRLLTKMALKNNTDLIRYALDNQLI
ncbi:MAG: response regulator transcription factor [Sediminibacterium sp.]|uniref:response regulator transcription factor n=1 Tax=Sediminibacterium sp. TaxID=1917865 RepID=UPI002ABA06FF|nr:response regulator transcription factor [Sediminibacterium sp.]MDZ4071843.1 response regulator transcription factor [Sediminibacterium sp.]